MTRMGPMLPVVGADTRFQPVYVDDVARAAVMGVTGAAKPGIYELGGPEVRTFRELMQHMLHRHPPSPLDPERAVLDRRDHGVCLRRVADGDAGPVSQRSSDP
jgi:nucleoside-diphosphate-sugar epimerase